MANELYPIFLKTNTFKTLIVGGGNVALEKLTFLLKSSPNSHVYLVAPEIKIEIQELAFKHSSVKLITREFTDNDLQRIQLLILATENILLNKEIKIKAKQLGILTNVADTPDECDFYLGSIVTRGALKVAISTNGKSPTFANRFREVLEEVLPLETTSLLDNLHHIRKQLKGTFSEKVKELNELTNTLISTTKKP